MKNTQRGSIGFMVVIMFASFMFAAFMVAKENTQTTPVTLGTSTTPYTMCNVTDTEVTVTQTGDKNFGTEVYKRITPTK